jgi:hypothetical protein
MIRYITGLALLVIGTMAAFAVTQSFNITVSIGNIMPAYNNLTANWSSAGLAKIGGIPNRTTICATVNPTGLIPPASMDDAQVIQNAVTNCPVGQVVQLAAGVFQLALSEAIILYKGVTLRGTGTCSGSGTSTGTGPYCQTIINNYNGQWTTYDNNCFNTTAYPPGASPGGGFSCVYSSFCSAICLQPTWPSSIGLYPGCSSTGNCPTTGLNWAMGGPNCQPDNNYNAQTGNCGTKLGADAGQGATTVQVTSTANFSVGGWVMIDEDPQLVLTTNPLNGSLSSIYTSPEFLNTSGSPVSFRVANPDGRLSGPAYYSFMGNGGERLSHEIHLVTSIGAGPCPGTSCTLTFDSPLTMTFRQSGNHDARVYWPMLAGGSSPIPFVNQAGVENLTITRAYGGGITQRFCAYCWAKNVEIAYWSGGPTWAFSARGQVTGSYIHHCLSCANAGAEYPFGLDRGSTEMLLDNNILMFAGKGMVGRAATSNVVAYNYQDKTSYAVSQAAIGPTFVDMGINGTHYAGTHHFLFEGNWAVNCDGDETHGNAFYHVYFRNNCGGIRTDFNDPSTGFAVSDRVCTFNGAGVNNIPPCQRDMNGNVNFIRAAGPMAYNYWYAYVGNVLGTAGVTTAANGYAYFLTGHGPPASFEPNGAIWISGWTGSEWNFWPDLNISAGASNQPANSNPQFIFRNGNFDYVTNSIADNASGYSQSFPNSLYLSSAPSYFTGAACTYPWPWVTPAGTSQIPNNSCGGSGLPAKARFDSGKPFVQP